MKRAIHALFFVSGALGLLYEVVWLRLLILTFGSTHFAVTAVLTAFMGGLALGAWIFGRVADRPGLSPLALYGRLEIGIGIYAVAIPYLFRALVPIFSVVWERWEPSYYWSSLIRFVLALLVLIVPTTLMGGTLPLLSRIVVAREEEIGASVGALYGINTFGAVAGTVATGFALIPAIGVSATIWIAAIANVAVGVGAIAISRRLPVGPAPTAAPAPTFGDATPRKGGKRAATASAVATSVAAPAVAGTAVRSSIVLWAIAGSGFLALVYEIAWTRVLALILGSSVYAFTAMLGTFLVGLALGASIGSRFADRRAGLDALATVLALAAAGGYATLLLMPRLPVLFAWAFHQTGLAAGRAEGLGGALSLLAVQFGIAFAVMLPATLFFGMVFPICVRLWSGGIDEVGRSVGSVYAANTAGTILGSALGGFVVLPVAGLQGGILAAVVGGLLLAALVAAFAPGRTQAARGALLAGGALLAAGLAFLRPAWDPIVMNSGVYQYVKEIGPNEMTLAGYTRASHRGVEMLFYEEGITANVLVAKEASRNIWLAINGKIDASSEVDIATQVLSGHLPLFFAAGAAEPNQAEVAVIGYATGMTIGAATRHQPKSVTAIEIEPAVLRASHHFDAFNHRPLEDRRVRVVEADGRNLLLVDPRKYDAIISEPSNPWITVAANLFTREFFETGRARLKPGGVFCQWIQMYGLRPQDMKALARTYLSVFPHVMVFLSIRDTDTVFLGSDAPLTIDLPRIRRVLAQPAVAADLARIGIADAEDFLTYHLMGEAEVRAYAETGPLNTDDRPLIEFGAPVSLYAETRKPNQAALDEHAGDPLAGASGMPSDPVEAAAEYVRLGQAFTKRGIHARAAHALRRAQSLHLDPATTDLLGRAEAAASASNR